MKVLKLLVILLLILPIFLHAQEPQELSQETRTEWIIPPQLGQIGKNIHFVVDFSGSMKQSQISHAIQQVIDIASANVDEINIKVTVFGANYATWPGYETNNNWTPLPSQDAIKALNQWFTDVYIDSGNTIIQDAFRTAMQTDVENMTVIIISDFEITDLAIEGRTSLLELIDQTQGARQYPVSFGFIGIRSSEHFNGIIRVLCEKIAGWLMVIHHPLTSEELEADGVFGNPH